MEAGKCHYYCCWMNHTLISCAHSVWVLVFSHLAIMIHASIYECWSPGQAYLGAGLQPRGPIHWDVFLPKTRWDLCKKDTAGLCSWSFLLIRLPCLHNSFCKMIFLARLNSKAYCHEGPKVSLFAFINLSITWTIKEILSTKPYNERRAGVGTLFLKIKIKIKNSLEVVRNLCKKIPKACWMSEVSL